MDVQGRKVTVMGLGHFGGGVAAARWLARHGAQVTVTDLADATALADSLAALDDEPIRQFHLGGHRQADFLEADVVVVNPAVRTGNRLLDLAVRSGARLTSEIELFLDAVPAQIVGVTGSNGKSTTAAMIAAILAADGRPTWLGGNIGRSLLGELDRIRPDDAVVLELSSFQLAHLPAGGSVAHVAVVTGCTPNHLDWHGDFRAYAAAKQRLLLGQSSDGLAVLNPHDAEVTSWEPAIRGRRLSLPADEEIPELSVPGRHNRLNAALAAAAALGMGCLQQAVQRGLAGFSGLPQRLQRMAVVAERVFYNDSTATTPESTVAALSALDQPVWLLAGGRDKGCEFGPLADAIVRHARGAAFFGQVRFALRDRVAAVSAGFPCTVAENLEDALSWCWRRSQTGDAIALSPACASDGPFRNFLERGRRFADLLRTLVV